MAKDRTENSDSFVQRGPVLPFSFSINVLYAGYEQCDPLHYAGPCYKKAYLWHIVLGGKGIFRCNGKEYRLGKGDMFLITPTDYIFYQADERDPWEYRWIKFDGSSVQYLLGNAGLSNQVFSMKEDQFAEAVNGFTEVLDFMRDETAPYLRATGRFYMLLGWYLQNFGEARQQTEDKLSFVKILDYINRHFTEDINMDEIARKSNYNRSHVYKLFIKNMGCSPKEYINNLRMDLACEILCEADYPIVQVSSRVGFKNYISFVNTFKKKYGVLPSQYRKSIGAGGKEGEKG